jgi:hypothetical protein
LGFQVVEHLLRIAFRDSMGPAFRGPGPKDYLYPVSCENLGKFLYFYVSWFVYKVEIIVPISQVS